jgi:hypothetical protein
VYTMVYWTLPSFVCTSWVGMNVSWVVVGESANALGERNVCVTSMHHIKSILMFEDDIT